MRTGDHPDDHIFPRLAAFTCPEFLLGSTRWGVGKGKRGTGRVVASRDLGIHLSFTVEASFYGGVEWRKEKG